ncbi:MULTISPECIES: cupin domain-containing protein [Brachyspira]|uniref:cupin domain-containing protein n=1 Tax=Brachyspira TaxID=29521 RepID=UPI000C76E254|nr:MULTISPECIES: cupin domain-containing protein [Brachyspira]PLV63164.1 cupin [Brachyspira pilosicoli SP16]
MPNFINNIDYKKVLSLKDTVEINSALTLVDRDNLAIKILSVDKDKSIPTHSSTGDVLVITIDGKFEMTIENDAYVLSEGESILIPANANHSLKAIEAFKVVVIQVKP